MTIPDATATVEIPAPGSYRIDAATSRIAFTAKHRFGTGTVAGAFAVSSGQIVVADPVIGSHVTAAASARSFDSANRRRDAQVISKTFLDADIHPDIEFRSTGVVSRDGRWVLLGELTAHGTSAPVELTIVELHTDPAGLTLRATGRVDRYAHGIIKMKGLAGRYLDLNITARASLT